MTEGEKAINSKFSLSLPQFRYAQQLPRQREPVFHQIRLHLKAVIFANSFGRGKPCLYIRFAEYNKNPCSVNKGFLLVDLIGFEPTTPTMRMWCAPSCATGPFVNGYIIVPSAEFVNCLLDILCLIL